MGNGAADAPGETGKLKPSRMAARAHQRIQKRLGWAALFGRRHGIDGALGCRGQEAQARDGQGPVATKPAQIVTPASP